ncbi:MAG: VIT1/CCC1 transporter family protein, partial [Acidimicrobiia bacterium]
HVGRTRQYVRDLILGVNDGLVSIFLLVAGVVGGSLSADQVLLAAIAGAIAGAISMGAGEYLATQSQQEVLDREITLEKQHIEFYRDEEVRQLHEMFTDLGISQDDLDDVVDAFSANDEILLNAMKVLEFGIVETEVRSPYRAMTMSGLLFLAGALPSVVPFALTNSTGLGLTIAGALTAAGLFGVGAVKTSITDGHPVTSGLKNLVIAGIGGVIAFGVGVAVNALMS